MKTKLFSEEIDVKELKREIQKATKEADKSANANSSKNGNSTDDDDLFIEDITKLLHNSSQTTQAPKVITNDDTNRIMIPVNVSFTSYTLKGLDHFATYAISVQACRQTHPVVDNNSTEIMCSFESQVVQRTTEDPQADLVEDLKVHVELSEGNQHNATLSWKSPANPNGRILNYIANIEKVGDKKFVDKICVQLKDRENVSTSLVTKLTPGNYSLQFAAFTLAGVGNFTKVQYFVVNPPAHSSVFTSPSFLLLMLLIVGAAVGVGIFKVYKRRHPHQETMRRLDNFDSSDLIE